MMDILILGYLDRNFGDDMMIRILADKLPDCNLYISTRDRTLFLPFENIENIKLIYDVKDRQFDAIVRVIGSGFTITGKMGLYYSLLHIFEYKKYKKHCKNLITIGCNIGPFFNRLAELLSAKEMQQFDLITTRDIESYRFIKTKAKKVDTFCFPDIVLSLPQKWIQKKVEHDACLGISAYRNTKHPEENYPFYKTMAFVADQYIEKEHKKVLLFAFDLGNENDLCAAYTIRSLCKNKDKIEIIAHTDNGDTILNNMIRCSRVIAVRFHSAIIAMRMKIPLLTIAYTGKHKAAFDALNFKCPLYTKTLNPEKDASNILDWVLNGDINYSLDSLDPAVIKQAEGHFEKLVQKIKTSI